MDVNGDDLISIIWIDVNFYFYEIRSFKTLTKNLVYTIIFESRPIKSENLKRKRDKEREEELCEPCRCSMHFTHHKRKNNTYNKHEKKKYIFLSEEKKLNHDVMFSPISRRKPQENGINYLNEWKNFNTIRVHRSVEFCFFCTTITITTANKTKNRQTFCLR